MLSSLWRHRNLIVELVKRDFTGRYQGSFGGIIWSFAQPLFLLSVYTLAFGVILKTRWGMSGDTATYAFMLFAGLIIFNMFSECLNKAPTLVIANPNYVKKVVFPLELLPVIMVSTAVIHALIGLTVWIVGFMILYGLPQPKALLFPLVLWAFIPILLGIGWLLSAIGVIVKDISQLTGMLSQGLLFLTPIFYSIDIAPPLVRDWLVLNPLTFIVEQFRHILFPDQSIDLGGLALYFLFSTLFAWVCFRIFKRIRPVFADVV